MTAAETDMTGREAGAGEAPHWRLAGVSYSVPGRSILIGIDLALAPGRVHGLIGPNGSGKSTLLRLIAGQLTPSAGTIVFEGRPLGDWRGRDFARRVAYLPQFTPATDGMSVAELVRLGRYPWHGMLGRVGPGDRAAVEAALQRTGLVAMAGRRVDTLSGGERQRAYVAMLLAQQAGCLVLDEPTSALDIAHQTELVDLLADLARHDGTTVIVVLHDLNLAARACDDLVALKDGRVLAAGPRDALMTADRLGGLYGVAMGVMPHPTRPEPLGYVL